MHVARIRRKRVAERSALEAVDSFEVLGPDHMIGKWIPLPCTDERRVEREIDTLLVRAPHRSVKVVIVNHKTAPVLRPTEAFTKWSRNESPRSNLATASSSDRLHQRAGTPL